LVERLPPIWQLPSAPSVGEDAAGLCDHREIGGVRFADAVQAAQRKHDLVAA
jgi:hypothetical protein